MHCLFRFTVGTYWALQKTPCWRLLYQVLHLGRYISCPETIWDPHSAPFYDCSAHIKLEQRRWLTQPGWGSCPCLLEGSGRIEPFNRPAAFVSSTTARPVHKSYTLPLFTIAWPIRSLTQTGRDLRQVSRLRFDTDSRLGPSSHKMTVQKFPPQPIKPILVLNLP